jgi:uncharacterized protein YecE (DUF72 family)
MHSVILIKLTLEKPKLVSQGIYLFRDPMKAYVGTSGWLYDWNEEATLDWYVEFSGLNAVELNASCYRFPFPNQVKAWSRKSKDLRWSVKTHRSITHLRRLKPEALNTWEKFRERFKPLEDKIDFYLFQLPPNFSCKGENLSGIERFYVSTGLGRRFAIEFRHSTCFNSGVAEWGEKLGLTIVSIDAPVARWVVAANNVLYMRLHGSTDWYGYEYSKEELAEIVKQIIDLQPEIVYVFFNNDHWMLENARLMKNLLEHL